MSMSDLPVPTPSSDPNAISTPSEDTNQSSQPITGHSVGVEGESFPVVQEQGLRPTAVEVDLPKEVQAAGVSQTPTTVTLPQPLVTHGVASVGQNVPPVTDGNEVTLPLTEEQMNNALKTGPKESIRWLAEWCVYQVKKRLWNHK